MVRVRYGWGQISAMISGRCLAAGGKCPTPVGSGHGQGNAGRPTRREGQKGRGEASAIRSWQPDRCASQKSASMLYLYRARYEYS